MNFKDKNSYSSSNYNLELRCNLYTTILKHSRLTIYTYRLQGHVNNSHQEAFCKIGVIKKASRKAWTIPGKKLYQFNFPSESKAACWRTGFSLKMNSFKYIIQGFCYF